MKDSTICLEILRELSKLTDIFCAPSAINPTATPSIYIPPLAEEAVNKPGSCLLVTDDDKKALAVCERGIPCVAFVGLLKWVEDRSRHWHELDKINWNARGVILVPDMETWLPENHLWFDAWCSINNELDSRGAEVYRSALIPQRRL